jgi:hypothetical protein
MQGGRAGGRVTQPASQPHERSASSHSLGVPRGHGQQLVGQLVYGTGRLVFAGGGCGVPDLHGRGGR